MLQRQVSIFVLNILITNFIYRFQFIATASFRGAVNVQKAKGKSHLGFIISFLLLAEVSYLTYNWLAILEEIPGFMNSTRRDYFSTSEDEGFFRWHT